MSDFARVVMFLRLPYFDFNSIEDVKFIWVTNTYLSVIFDLIKVNSYLGRAENIGRVLYCPP